MMSLVQYDELPVITDKGCNYLLYIRLIHPKNNFSIDKAHHKFSIIKALAIIVLVKYFHCYLFLLDPYL